MPTTDVPEESRLRTGDRTFDDLQALLTARFVHSGDEIVTIDEDGTRLVREPAVADGGLKLAEAIEKKPELLGKLAEAALADAQKMDGDLGKTIRLDVKHHAYLILSQQLPANSELARDFAVPISAYREEVGGNTVATPITQ